MKKTLLLITLAIALFSISKSSFAGGGRRVTWDHDRVRIEPSTPEPGAYGVLIYNSEPLPVGCRFTVDYKMTASIHNRKESFPSYRNPYNGVWNYYSDSCVPIDKKILVTVPYIGAGKTVKVLARVERYFTTEGSWTRVPQCRGDNLSDFCAQKREYPLQCSYDQYQEGWLDNLECWTAH